MNNEHKSNINSVNVIQFIDDILPEDINTIPATSGVYMIKYISGNRYIGSSKDIRARTCQWIRNSHIDEHIIFG